MTRRANSYLRPLGATGKKGIGSGSRVTKSIVIPAYNESYRLERAFGAFASEVDWDDTEVIVVDDGSDDDTAGVAERLLAPYPFTLVIRLDRNRGKGSAVRVGITRARGCQVAFTDADMATDPQCLSTLFDKLADSEVVIGSRAHPDSVVKSREASRMLFGKAFNRFVRTVTDLSTEDTQCGFKAFRTPAAKLLFHAARIDGYAFDVEILMLAKHLGMRVQEMAVDWTDVKGSHVRPMVDSVPMVFDVLRSEMTWRNARPVEAISVIGQPGISEEGMKEVAAALGENIRFSDSVVSWSKGALALLPGLPSGLAMRMRDRLEERLPHFRIYRSAIEIRSLIHPSAAPLLAAIRSMPDANDFDSAIVCDDDTASRLLASIGAA